MNRSLVVDILCVIFGIGAWISINGLWVELPILVQKLPEGWTLPSYISIVVQIANIGPITYTLLRLWRPSIPQVPVVYLILFIGCTSSLFLALFWDVTTFFGTEEHSLPFLCLVFFLSLVDCTSSILYTPYIAQWREIYLPSYLIGEGLSGCIPAVVALGQGVGGTGDCKNVSLGQDENGTESWAMVTEQGEPNFSADVFFYMLWLMMIASALSFILLEKIPSIQKERSKVTSSRMFLTENNSDISQPSLQTSSIKGKTFAFLLFLLGWESLLSNGFLPSVQSYSCLPYGNVVFHLVVIFCAFANPLAAFSTIIVGRNSPVMVGILATISTGLASYALAMAVMSPTPILMNNIGSVLIFLTWVGFSGVTSYVRVEISNLMRAAGASCLFWAGTVTQAGAAIGALIGFLLVNQTHIFQAYDPCN